jgi:hypothetical protein
MHIYKFNRVVFNSAVFCHNFPDLVYPEEPQTNPLLQPSTPLSIRFLRFDNNVSLKPY